MWRSVESLVTYMTMFLFFSIFRNGVVCHFEFLSIRNINGDMLRGSVCVSDSAYQISWRSIELLLRYGDFFHFFSENVDLPPFWICYARDWTTHKGHLMVLINVQSLLRIDAVVSQF